MTARNNSIIMVLTTFGMLACITFAGQAKGGTQAAPFLLAALTLGVAVFVLIIKDSS